MAGQANGRFVQDITIPDDTPVTAGAAFTKIWQVQNTGSVAWGPGFKLVHSAGDPMTIATRLPLPPCAPGQTAQIALSLTAPLQTGKRYTDWRFQDDKGNFFGEILYARIMCQAAPVTVSKNGSYFLADVTIPDDTRFKPGQSFVKTWKVRNSGDLPWSAGYTLRFVNGNALTSITQFPLPGAVPGAEVQISVSLTAPAAPGTYFGDWRMFDAQEDFAKKAPDGILEAPIGVAFASLQRRGQA
ncbi:MAG TPA: NBR1-Ig-like domain-containing protein [Phototrophicaceae bacterium]|nr:NBR1-Ig-like domain-containing protein [Phototrophicaceae bacterium]